MPRREEHSIYPRVATFPFKKIGTGSVQGVKGYQYIGGPGIHPRNNLIFKPAVFNLRSADPRNIGTSSQGGPRRLEEKLSYFAVKTGGKKERNDVSLRYIHILTRRPSMTSYRNLP